MAGRADLVQLYGDDPIAYSTLQPGLRYLDASYGYIAYQRAWGTDITLGAPVAAPADQALLISRFLRTRARPMLCYLRAENVRGIVAASDRPLHMAGMGIDRLLDSDVDGGWAASGREPKPVRGARKHAQRARFSLQRVAASDLSASDRARIAAITATYLRHSQLPYEMRFLNRPLSLQAGDDLSRIYLLRQREDHLFGYAVCNPWFVGGRVVGYLLDILRCEPTRQWGVFYAVVDQLRRDLAADGIRTLSLGFCPLYKATQPSDLPLSPRLTGQVRWLEQHLAAVPYVQRLREIKDALPGPDCPRYFASHSPWAATAFVALLGACGVSLASIVGPQLLQSIRAGRSGGHSDAT